MLAAQQEEAMRLNKEYNQLLKKADEANLALRAFAREKLGIKIPEDVQSVQ